MAESRAVVESDGRSEQPGKAVHSQAPTVGEKDPSGEYRRSLCDGDVALQESCGLSDGRVDGRSHRLGRRCERRIDTARPSALITAAGAKTIPPWLARRLLRAKGGFSEPARRIRFRFGGFSLSHQRRAGIHVVSP